MRRLLLLWVLLLTGCAAGSQGVMSPEAEQVPAPGEPGAGPDLGSGMSPAAVSLLEQSRAQRRAGELVQASASLERALRIEPSRPELWLELGELRFEQGASEQAAQLARKAISLAGGDSIIRARAEALLADAQRWNRR